MACLNKSVNPWLLPSVCHAEFYSSKCSFLSVRSGIKATLLSGRRGANVGMLLTALTQSLKTRSGTTETKGNSGNAVSGIIAVVTIVYN